MLVDRKDSFYLAQETRIGQSASDPWDEHIDPLFNDETFTTPVIDSLSGGVKHADISGKDPAKIVRERDLSVLKERFT